MSEFSVIVHVVKVTKFKGDERIEFEALFSAEETRDRFLAVVQDNMGFKVELSKPQIFFPGEATKAINAMMEKFGE